MGRLPRGEKDSTGEACYFGTASVLLIGQTKTYMQMGLLFRLIDTGKLKGPDCTPYGRQPGPFTDTEEKG